LIAVGTLLAAPRVRAQTSSRTYRVGVLLPMGAEAMKPYRAALAAQLATHGFVEGRNLELEVHSATELFHDDRNLVLNILKKETDALFSCGTRPTEAAKAATQTVPIVFAWVPDPVASGLVPALAHPGANVTGVSTRYGELMAKRLELALQLRPATKRIAVIVHPLQRAHMNSVVEAYLRPATTARGVTLIVIDSRRVCCGLAEMFDAAVKDGAEAVLPTLTYTRSPFSGAQLIERSRTRRVPVIFSDGFAVEQGGLMSYGTNLVDDVRRGANLLARVLGGTRPADLPIEQPTQFELVVNLKTAKTLGLTIPQEILWQATRVIE
jgi:putative tryptophan/tyrosine transport system substrate-binding protein